jgi:WD40 repeat protein
MTDDGSALARLQQLLRDDGDRQLLRQAVDSGRITLEQAQQAVEQCASAGSLGEILIGRGWLESVDLVEMAFAAHPGPAPHEITARAPGTDAPAEPEAPPATPSARFNLEQKLGVGGMGEVWKAWDTRLKRWTALKFLKEESPYEIGRFSKEAQTAARLSHPHVAAIYEVGKEGGRRYIAMQFVDGVPLSKVPRSDVRRLVELVRQAALAVHYAHGQNVIHRDLKPANIMVEGSGDKAHAFVLDFGLAKTVNVDSSLSVSGAIVGTPTYMSPEQASGLAVDGRTDVYSLGATLYELLTDKAPFDGSHLFHVIKQVIEEDPTPPRRLKAELDPDLETIVQKCMDKDPARRYSNAAALAEELRRYLDGEPILAHPPSTLYRMRKRVRRNPWAWGLSAAAVLILTAGTILYIVHLSRAREEAETERRRAELRLAEAYVAQGDALLLAGRGAEARARFEEAYRTFERLGASTLPAELGMGEAHRRSPPPVLALKGSTPPYYSAAVSADGRKIVSAGTDKLLWLWDAVTGRRTRTFAGHTDAIWGAAFLPDGGRAITCSRDRTLRLWDLSTRESLRTFTGHADEVIGVAVSPDGRRVLSGSQDGTVKLWDVESGTEIRTFRGHEGGVYRVAISPDGGRALSAGEDKTMKLWDVETGREIRSFPGHTQAVCSVGFSPEGDRALSGSKDRDIKLWEVETGRELKTLKGHANAVWQAAFSPDGRRVLSAGTDGAVKLWDTESGREIGTLAGHTDSVYDARFFPDGRLALSASYDASLRLWDVASLAEPRPFAAHGAVVHAAACSPDGLLALSAGADGKVRVLDIATGHELRAFVHPRGPVYAAVFSPDGSRILAAGADPTLRLWDIGSGGEVGAFPGHGQAVLSLAFSPDGRRAVSGGLEHAIRLWDLGAGREIRAFEGHVDAILSLAFSPDGRHVTSGSRDFTHRLWDTETGRQLFKFTGPETRDSHGITAVAFSADGRSILSGTGREGIQIYESSTGREIRSLSGHTHRVTGVCFSPDGRQALSSSMDRTVRLWEVGSGREIRVFSGLDDTTRGAAFAPDGRAILAAVGSDLRMWKLTRSDYRALEAELETARERFSTAPDDSAALAVMARWYAVRGLWARAAELHERARAAGAAVSALESGRTLWQKGDFAAARREFEQALARGEAPASYLKLCLQAMEREGASR